MMKKILSAAFVASLALIGHVSEAAPPAPAVSTVRTPVTPIPHFTFTTIKGEIKVPATFSSSGYGNGPVALGQGGFGCSNIVVIANSKELKPRPANYDGFWIDQPVWTRSVQASGNYSSGKCSYNLVVPGDAQFKLVAGTSGNFNCNSIMLDFGSSTPSWQSVPKGTSKVDDLSINSITCNIIG